MSALKLSRMKELMGKELLDINEAKELGHLRMEYLLTHEGLETAC